MRVPSPAYYAAFFQTFFVLKIAIYGIWIHRRCHAGLRAAPGAMRMREMFVLRVLVHTCTEAHENTCLSKACFTFLPK